MKLAVVTQAVDLDDPILGATVPKLRALAERVDELVVLTLREGEHGLPGNVRISSSGIRYSNIVPPHETRVAWPLTLVTGRPR